MRLDAQVKKLVKTKTLCLFLVIKDMPRTKKIKRHPERKNYFLVDACFLANKYIPIKAAKNGDEEDRIRKCKQWWKEIDVQVRNGRATVYVPDICIAETFKVFAERHYKKRLISAQQHKSVRDRMLRDTHIDPKALLRHKRDIRYHDIETNRDIVISVKRFYEGYFKKGYNVSVVDLFVLAIGKYLMDFYGFTRENLFIVTIDAHLYEGSKQFADVPFVFNPLRENHEIGKVFT